jgi:protease I
MALDLTSVKLAILVANGYESDEVIGPRDFLRRAGATPKIVSPEKAKVSEARGDSLPVDVPLQHADEAGFDVLLIPGGKKHSESLAENAEAVNFVKSFITSEKPVAAISLGVKLLIKANAVSGRWLTGDASLQDEVKEVGAKWVDRSVVVDRDLVTSSGGDALASLNQAFAEVCLKHKAGSGASLHAD